MQVATSVLRRPRRRHHHRRHGRRLQLRHPAIHHRRGRLAGQVRAGDHPDDVARVQPLAAARRPQPELGDDHEEHGAAGGGVQVRRAAVRPRAGRRQGRQARPQEDAGVPPRHGPGERLRVAGQRRRRRVQGPEQDRGVRAGGGGHRRGAVHAAAEEEQAGGDLQAQAEARLAGDGRRGVREGEMQAREGEEGQGVVNLLATVYCMVFIQSSKQSLAAGCQLAISSSCSTSHYLIPSLSLCKKIFDGESWLLVFEIYMCYVSPFFVATRCE
ncbi:hypothetical protein VPH35_115933 [Triticum aestivum]